MSNWPWRSVTLTALEKPLSRSTDDALLAPSRGILEPPIRAEIFGTIGFAQNGRQLAQTHGEAHRSLRPSSFFPRLRENIAVLHEAHRSIARQERRGRHVGPAGEWLLDNIHLVVAQTRAVHDGLARRYFRSLPVLANSELAGLPRVYAIAWAYVAHADSAFEPALLVAFLQGYQDAHTLTQGELWALPTTLRVVLVENLRRLAERISADQAAREAAHALCDGLDTEGAAPPQAMFDRAQARGVIRAFALQVMQRLHADSETGTLEGTRSREAIRAALALALPDPATAQAAQQIDQAADNLSVGNAIRSLQLLGNADWRGIIAQVSSLMQHLSAMPAFAAERSDTQDTTLHAIERLARRSSRTEADVAKLLLRLAQAPAPAIPAGARSATRAPNPPAPRTSPGYWLHGEGQAQLRAALGLRPALRTTSGALRARIALPALVAALGLGTIMLTSVFMSLAAEPDIAATWWVAGALLALWPASETVIAAVNRLISESLPPRRLPRLALADGIPLEHRVLVVLPSMLTDPATIDALAARLERHHLANREDHAQFALLTDFADADSAIGPGDAPRLAQAVSAIAALNARHPCTDPAQSRFLLLHRARQWCETEHKWIGWERKRGKIEQLVALLADPAVSTAAEHPLRIASPASPFLDLGPLSRVADKTPYLLTLDSDTVLPPGALRDLVGIAAHPLNQPHFDWQFSRVISGHGILQPRIVTAWPEPRQATWYHQLFAGAPGSDPYNACASEVYQDLFDEGSFTGKGLLNVAAMQTALAGRLPENQVLSHDLLEGCIARCGSVSDVALIEAAPAHADVAASRTHRWTRGDWQLLPLLLHPRRYSLRAIDLWKLTDNLRRSLVAPMSGLLLLIGLTGGPISPWGTLALAAAAFGAGPLVGAIAGLAPSRDDLALRHFARQALADLARAVLGLAWHLALWLRETVLLTDAITRALWRTLVSRRRLLQWTTAAAAESDAAQGWRPLLRRHAGVTTLALALGASLLLAGSQTPWLVIALCALWAGTPFWIAVASRPPVQPGAAPLSDVDRNYLQPVARETWAWFAEYVGAQSNHLPPDNVQTVPRLMIAQRTSPTNIGLYLLAAACARAFGWITSAEMVTRLEATLDTLERLPRERGHFMNWIDTQTLQTLLPAYLSTVDSGNLCGHLLAVACACDELILELNAAPRDTATSRPLAGEETQARLAAVASRCRRIAQATEFGFLYDSRRQLMHIGWRVAEQHLDAGHYDLLASESRLASLWAIAKGDLPAAHWAALGRPFQATGAEVGLRSWSGSMFEYLMPTLILDEPHGSALACAAHMAVAEQRSYARLHDAPWGISESAYAAIDRSLAYQYGPQGVPRLALRRTPVDELVVAPYATALAAMLDPAAAIANLHRLQALSARGTWGFIEALDFTPQRQTDGSRSTSVNTFMAHHQAMTLVALANVLLNGAPRRWGMADPRMAAVASLLQERVPREVSRLRNPEHGTQRTETAALAAPPAREVQPGAQALQRTQLLSNGRYSVALRSNGAGWSRLGETDITRTRDDALRDAHGSFVYLRRPGRDAPVSLTQHPAPDPAAHYAAHFLVDRLCLEATWPDLRSRCTVWVSPEDDIEIRHVALSNTSSHPIELTLLSAWEACLSQARADEMHPAFANLFVDAEWDAHDRALYLARKPRREDEPALHAVHFIAQADAGLTDLQALADRSHWLGRQRDAGQPRAAFGDAAHGQAGSLASTSASTSADTSADTPSGPCATGLDPIAALSMRLTLLPYGTAHVTLATAAAATRANLEALVDRYRQASVVQRSSQLSATLAALQQRERHLAPDDLVAIQTLTTTLVMLHSRPAATAAHLDSGVIRDRRALWRFGLSGERPMIVVTVSAAHGLRLVAALVQGLLHWAWGGVGCDLVVINTEPHSYLMPLQRELIALREGYAREVSAFDPGRSAGLFVLQNTDISVVERSTLALLARVRLNADGRPLNAHVADLVAWHDNAQTARDQQNRQPQLASISHAAGFAAAGGFDASNGHYRFVTSSARPTPRPWVNVLANPDFGALVSEAGAGCTWAGNSRLHQLTPWGNDPLTDMNGECFFLQDLRTHELWNAGAGPGCADVPYAVEHGPGSSTLRHRRGVFEVAAAWSIDCSDAVKRVRITLRNHGTRPETVRVMGLLEWMLGSVRVDRQSVRTAFVSLPEKNTDSRTDVLVATQLDDHDATAGQTAFLMLRAAADGSTRLQDWTCDRRELFDERGCRAWPDQLGRRAGGGADPCAAASITLALAAGASAGCVFLIGHGSTLKEAVDLAQRCAAVDPGTAEASAGAQAQALLGAVSVSTPDPLFDVLVNHWLLYQTTACRLWGRAGFYQAGGAYGFRDQLQDAMALATTAPGLLRAHLLRAAARQFVQGDVQHWWHPHSGAGVRTRFSDDLLWLTHAALHYVAATGDKAVYDERVPFIEGDEVPADAEDAYYIPRISDQHATLYEHCARTLERSLATGAHGLPLMGSGDWNDGMNRVGAGGRGESVWLGWFLCQVAGDFAAVARARGETTRAATWETALQGWRQALQASAWDGEWFVRAFFDDGTPLGSHGRKECRIDLIAQAWSVLSGAAPVPRQQMAMASAQRLLADPEHGLLRLLDPPLIHSEPAAGYIQAYPAGVRENGGQYNHGAAWAAMAWAQLGDGDAAYRAWVACSPAHRAAHPQHGPLYGLEPYAVAADIYSQPPYAGRGGWSWYTGSAAVLHRAAVGAICGLVVEGERARLQPALPGHWPRVDLTLRRDGRVHRFTVCAAHAKHEIAATLAQGASLLPEGDWLRLTDTAAPSHHLIIGAHRPAAPPA